MQTIKQEQLAKAEYILSLYDSKLTLEPMQNNQVQTRPLQSNQAYAYNIYNKDTIKG